MKRFVILVGWLISITAAGVGGLFGGYLYGCSYMLSASAAAQAEAGDAVILQAIQCHDGRIDAVRIQVPHGGVIDLPVPHQLCADDK